jgi:hypothetical protein
MSAAYPEPVDTPWNRAWTWSAWNRPGKARIHAVEKTGPRTRTTLCGADAYGVGGPVRYLPEDVSCPNCLRVIDRRTATVPTVASTDE